jgi:2-polyprenyl-6-methoxyphenol hydroxylase-like FAD-dependent oxidoreductase
MVGSLAQRFICYPIEPLDQNGETLLNWIAELRSEDSSRANKSDWNKPAEAGAFIDEFIDWDFGWLNVPEIVAQSQGIWEFPMVDRDPVDCWTDGRAVLLGDAAHAMFPHGSAGASQAIVGARHLGAAIKKFGPTPKATQAFETLFLPGANALAERNRGEGPIGVLIKIEERIALGQSIDESIDEAEIAAYMARYKTAAGLARDTLNESPAIIAQA